MTEHELAVPSSWTFFSNHAHVLFYVARYPDARIRDIANAVGITGRAVQRILRELSEAHVVISKKRGRRNHYFIRGAAPLRHPLESHKSVADLIELVALPLGRTG